MYYNINKESKINYKNYNQKCEKISINRIHGKREIIFVQVESNAIYYETLTEKLTIIGPFNEVLHSKYVVLLNAYNYSTKNVIKALGNKA